MKLQRLGILAGIALTATVALAACGTDNNSNAPSSNSTTAAAGCATGTVNAQGSTAQANAIAKWIANYNSKCGSSAKINYNGTGSGAGETAFIQGTADFAGSDSALTAGEQQTSASNRCKAGPAIDLPMVIGPIAVVYNLPGVSNLQFKPATLAGIFAGKITTWNDAAIAADNPGAKLPSTKITTVHRSDQSGTSDNFTNYLTQTAPSAWSFGHDKAWKAPGGDGETGSAGVAQEVKSTEGAISYIEWSYVTADSLTMAKIYNGAGEWSSLTAESAGATIGGAQITGTGDDLQMKIDYNTKTAGAYPIVLVTYEIVCDKGTPAKALPLVKSFLEYTSSADGQNALTSVGSAPLPDSVRTKVASIVGNLS